MEVVVGNDGAVTFRIFGDKAAGLMPTDNGGHRRRRARMGRRDR
jgi:hypothetical protein